MQFGLSVPEKILTLRNPEYETSVVNNHVFTGSFMDSREYEIGSFQKPDSVVASTQLLFKYILHKFSFFFSYMSCYLI